MNLGDLRTALQARGFNHLSTTEIDRCLNYAYSVDICEAEDWPFLETTATGSSPLTISDLRAVESVIDTTNDVKLIPLDRRTITDFDVDLARAGAPTNYYVTSGTIVNVYPANTVSLSVRYWEVPTALSSESDTPVIPTRFHPVIVDAAVMRAYELADEYVAQQAAFTAFQGRLEQMRFSLLEQQHDRPDDFIVTTIDVQ